jgi:hypothetical protein
VAETPAIEHGHRFTWVVLALAIGALAAIQFRRISLALTEAFDG